MTDVLTPNQRSFCMSRIKSTKTKPEDKLRKALWTKGIRYKKSRKIFGNPDVVFVGKKVAIFVDGCFWHSCPLHLNLPKTNEQFWREKLSKNVERDIKVNSHLTSEGWTILRCWEHEINTDVDAIALRIQQLLSKN